MDFDKNAYEHDYDLTNAMQNDILLDASNQSAKRLTFTGEFAPYTSAYQTFSSYENYKVF